MDLSAGGWRSAFRIELRVQAIGLSSRGWPVLPGTYPTKDRWVGRNGAETDGPVPVHRDWEQRLGTDPDHVASWWSGRPYSLLLATGPLVEAPVGGSGPGRRAAVELRSQGAPVPIAATPGGRWYLLTRGGQTLDGELAAHPDVSLHSAGSWLPLPPSTFPQGLVHWRVKPQVCDWRLPEPHVVQDALRAALHERAGVADLAATAG